MGRRRKRDAGDDAEALVKGGFFLVLFLALAIGGITKLPQTLALLAHLLWWSVGALLVLAVGGVAIWLGWRVEETAEARAVVGPARAGPVGALIANGRTPLPEMRGADGLAHRRFRSFLGLLALSPLPLHPAGAVRIRIGTAKRHTPPREIPSQEFPHEEPEGF